MKYFKFTVLMLVFLLNLISCSTIYNTEKENIVSFEYNKLFDEYRKYSGAACMGISGPYEDRHKALEVATENCLQMLAYAEQLAIQIDYSTVVKTENNTNDFGSKQISGTSDANYNKAASEMEILDALWLGGNVGAVVFARIPSLEKVNWNSDIDWINNEILIDGYTVASASSRKTYTSFVKAIEEASFRAAGALLNVDSTAINVTNHLADITSTTYNADTYSISGSRVSGFVILDYKYNQKENKVYALAISKKEGRI